MISKIILFVAGYLLIKKLFFSSSPETTNDIRISNETPSQHQSITYIDSNGYRRFINSDKLVHRWVIEKKLGRRLYGFEVVHHRDRNKLNNNLDNLVLMNRDDHNEIHKEYLIRIGVLERN